MNKYITMLLLGVVAAGMAMVLFVHAGKSPDEATHASSVSITGESSFSAPASGNGEEQASAEGTPPGAASEQDNTAIIPQEEAGGLAANTQEPASAGTTAESAAAGSTPTSPNTGTATSAGSGASVQPATQTGGAQTPPPSAGRAGLGPVPASVTVGQGTIKDVRLSFSGTNGMVLRIEGDGPLPVKYFILSDPERLVIDLPGIWANLKTPAIPGNTLLKSARLGRQGNADRIVLDLQRSLSKHGINRLSDNAVEVFFE